MATSLLLTKLFSLRTEQLPPRTCVKLLQLMKHRMKQRFVKNLWRQRFSQSLLSAKPSLTAQAPTASVRSCCIVAPRWASPRWSHLFPYHVDALCGVCPPTSRHALFVLFVSKRTSSCQTRGLVVKANRCLTVQHVLVGTNSARRLPASGAGEAHL